MTQEADDFYSVRSQKSILKTTLTGLKRTAFSLRSDGLQRTKRTSVGNQLFF